MLRGLRDSVVGIVGYGSVGREIARLARAFGAIVLAAKRDAMRPEDPGYIIPGLGDPSGDLFHRLYPPQAIRSMVKECDFVVVTVPLTPQTRNLLGPAELGALKPSAYLVDIGRGGVIDQNALITALREHKIAGAALDVFVQEPLPPEHPFWAMINVMVTAHLGGFCDVYVDLAMPIIEHNIRCFLAGRLAEMINFINR